MSTESIAPKLEPSPAESNTEPAALPLQILVLNAGSSSHKACLYKLELNRKPSVEAPEPAWRGQLDWKGANTARVRIHTADGAGREEEIHPKSRSDGLATLLRSLWTGHPQVLAGPQAVGVVGHRVVHGGSRFKELTPITGETKQSIAELAQLAPLHNRADLEGIETVERIFGDVPQAAVFDTAFHATLPAAAAAYPGPYEWFARGLRRYGFHGINHQYCAERAGELMKRPLAELRLVTCHLGGGCSLAAIRGGVSVDTTMGFTPLEGLMMATRSGSIDPGLITYLISRGDYTAAELSEVLNKASGLLGISGVSADLREVLSARAKGDMRARMAVEIFVHRLRRNIGAMLGSLDALDAVVFTGGIGENSAEVRERACETFRWLELEINREKNKSVSGDADIATRDSGVRVLVIRAREEWLIARQCWAFRHRLLRS